MLTRLAFSAKRRHRTALLLSAAVLLASCGGGGGSSSGAPTPAPAAAPAPAPTSAAGCSLAQRQSWVLAQLQESYLFPTLLDTTVNPAAHSTVQSYIDALVAPARAQNRDRFFTYLTSITEEDAYYRSGATAGFGIRLAYDSTNNRVYVIEAFEGGQALANGIDRGTELLQINNQSVASLMSSGGPGAVQNALGPDTVGTSRTFGLRDVNSGVQRTVTISKTEFALDPVSNRYGAKVIVDGAKKVGYINLRTFIDTADADLRAAFADFKAQGITELIIDLRYNGGGLVRIAELMGDLMALGRGGQVFSYTTFRDSKASNNQTDLFTVQSQSIAPTKVAFIGTGSSASASELVINAMIPYLRSNMALVGSNTYGKPVGQSPFDRAACDDRLRAVTFKTENADRQGEYYTGLAAVVPNSCRATDDITHQLGDPNEGMIVAALNFLGGRSCTPIGAVTTQALGQREVLRSNRSDSTIARELPGAF